MDDTDEEDNAMFDSPDEKDDGGENANNVIATPGPVEEPNTDDRAFIRRPSESDSGGENTEDNLATRTTSRRTTTKTTTTMTAGDRDMFQWPQPKPRQSEPQEQPTTPPCRRRVLNTSKCDYSPRRQRTEGSLSTWSRHSRTGSKKSPNQATKNQETTTKTRSLRGRKKRN